MRVGAYTFQGPVPVLLRRLQAAEFQDRRVKSAAERRGCAGIVLFTLALAGGYRFGQGAGVAWAVVGAVFLILAASAWIWTWKTFQHDLDDRKLETLIRFFTVLGVDIPRSRNVRVRVDFRPYLAGGKTTRRETRGALTVSEHEHPWLAVAAELADGGALELRLTEHVRRKHKVRNRGQRLDERYTSELDLTIRSPDAAAAASRLGAPPSGMTVRRASADGRRLRARLSSRGTPWGADELLCSLLWAYGAFAPPVPMV